MAGYPSTNKASAAGFGGQLGLFYDSATGFKAGASYKTTVLAHLISKIHI